jgi:hypothetical protein
MEQPPLGKSAPWAPVRPSCNTWLQGERCGQGIAAMMRVLAIVFAVAGAVCWSSPGFISGLFFRTLIASPGESRIIGALFFVGAAILWFIRAPDHK